MLKQPGENYQCAIDGYCELPPKKEDQFPVNGDVVYNVRNGQTCMLICADGTGAKIVLDLQRRSSTNPANRSVTNSRSRFISRTGTASAMAANTRTPVVLVIASSRCCFSCAAFVSASGSVRR
jgi:hypothetical protein